MALNQTAADTTDADEYSAMIDAAWQHPYRERSDAGGSHCASVPLLIPNVLQLQTLRKSHSHDAQTQTPI